MRDDYGSSTVLAVEVPVAFKVGIEDVEGGQLVEGGGE